MICCAKSWPLFATARVAPMDKPKRKRTGIKSIELWAIVGFIYVVGFGTGYCTDALIARFGWPL